MRFSFVHASIIRICFKKEIGINSIFAVLRSIIFYKLTNRSEKLVNLAHGLAPCYLRLGGTAADLLTFDPQKTAPNKPWSAQQYQEFLLKKHYKNFTMSGLYTILMLCIHDIMMKELEIALKHCDKDKGSCCT